jgi:hypothetical protein
MTFRSPVLLSGLALALTVTTFLPSPTQASEASLYLSARGGAYQTGKSFTARIMLGSGGSPVNAAESILTYDPKAIRIDSLTASGSIFKLWTTEPKFSNTAGTIEFGGGLPDKYSGATGLVATLKITPLKNGPAKLSFATSSQILTADGQAQNILKDFGHGSYLFGTTKTVSDAQTLTNKMLGRILLQVEDSGRSWYLNPIDKRRYYLGRPADAFNIMRKLGLGANHKYITTYQKGKFPKQVAGRILIDVEDFGKAYYINPLDLKAHYLGRPDDAFAVMRKLGLGISNANIDKIIDWSI